MGHIVEWMTGDIEKDFSITGGEVNRGRREKDVAIADMNREQRWAPMTAAGCRISGIQRLFDVLTDDNTWASRNKKKREHFRVEAPYTFYIRQGVYLVQIVPERR